MAHGTALDGWVSWMGTGPFVFPSWAGLMDGSGISKTQNSNFVIVAVLRV